MANKLADLSKLNDFIDRLTRISEYAARLPEDSRNRFVSVELHEAGLNYSQIGAIVGFTSQTAHYHGTMAIAERENPEPSVFDIPDEYLTREELAHMLGKSVPTLDRWHRLRQGPVRTKIGKSVMYRRDSIRKWIESNEEAS